MYELGTVNKWECAYNRYHMHSSKYWLADDETSERVQHLCSFQTQVLAEMNRTRQPQKGSAHRVFFLVDLGDTLSQ